MAANSSSSSLLSQRECRVAANSSSSLLSQRECRVAANKTFPKLSKFQYSVVVSDIGHPSDERVP